MAEYAKAFELDGTFMSPEHIPEGYRSEWATDVTNSGFMLWKYQVGSGFSKRQTPNQSENFYLQIEQGDTMNNAMVQ